MKTIIVSILLLITPQLYSDSGDVEEIIVTADILASGYWDGNALADMINYWQGQSDWAAEALNIWDAQEEQCDYEQEQDYLQCKKSSLEQTKSTLQLCALWGFVPNVSIGLEGSAGMIGAHIDLTTVGGQFAYGVCKDIEEADAGIRLNDCMIDRKNAPNCAIQN